MRSTPRGGVSAGSRWRDRATRAPANPRSRARAENGVTLAGNVIEPTCEVQPHFIWDSSREPDASTCRAIERRSLVPSTRNGSQCRGAGKEQQRQGARGAPSRAILEEGIFALERPMARLAFPDPKHGVRSEGQCLHWDISTIHELCFEGCRGHQGRRVP